MMMLAMLAGLGSTRRFLLANAALLVAAFGVYYAIGIRRHFKLPDGDAAGPTTVAYLATGAHTGVVFGDVSPKTTLARWLFVVHVLLAWALIAIASTDSNPIT